MCVSQSVNENDVCAPRPRSCSGGGGGVSWREREKSGGKRKRRKTCINTTAQFGMVVSGCEGEVRLGLGCGLVLQ